MFIVVFHYIIGSGYPGFELRGPTTDDFLRLLHNLGTQYKMVDLSTLVKKKNEGGGERICSIIFDDGVVDHYNISDELFRRKIPATFFPVASVFDGHVPSPIKMHIILSKVKINDVAEKLEEFLLKRGLSHFVPLPRDKKIKTSNSRPRDDILTANLKHVMQNLSEEVKKVFVDEQFSRIVSDEKKFCQEFFMTPHQLREMHKKGIEIGCHTYSHASLRTMSYAEQKKDIAKSKKIIEDIIEDRATAISYPFGDYNQDTVAVVKDLGFKYGVVNIHRQVAFVDDDLLLPDCDWCLLPF